MCRLCAMDGTSAHSRFFGVQSYSRSFGSTLTRLTKEQIRQFRARLEAWQRPSKMLRLSRSLMDRMGSDDLFNQPGVDFITEAWAAAQFARARRALAVRLVSGHEQWPDLEMRLRSRVESRWEFTEVDKPWRRRGYQARRMARRLAAGKSTARGVSARQIAKQAAQVPTWIRRRCRAKASKFYSARVGLLIYLNWSDFGWHHEVAQTFVDATSPAKDAFTEIWILWQTQVHRTWRNGTAAVLVRMAPGTYDRYSSR